ncbi:MAG: helix-turn-helix transcriptional regulator [Oscillospiraceae bacterium]|nr:helix-turn-helix transcriptional regulator [Oscillospiraceae bacterium]
MVKNLRLLREEKGISQQKLAEMLNTSQQNIFKYEKTACEPDISTLIKIADLFNVTVDYLIGNSEIREKDIKLNAVMLTEQEKQHMNLWRKLPQEIQEKIDKLIESIKK